MTKDKILIDLENVPYSFNILLADDLFNLEVNYNENADLFTISLSKDDELICVEPIIYNVPLFSDCYMPEKYPAITITPIDESGEENTVSYDNFGKTVFLVIDNGDASGGDTNE